LGSFYPPSVAGAVFRKLGHNHEMDRGLRKKAIVGVAIAAVLAGGAVAAMGATGHSPHHKVRAAHKAGARGGRRAIATATSYLGLSTAQLESDLKSGKTLGQVADATAGKSEAGLIGALVAARKARLSAKEASLPQRVTAEVNRAGGPRSPASRARAVGGLFAARGHLALAATSYLGLSTAQLESDLKSGKTLAQVANGTSGKSEAGLIEALVAARKKRLAAAVTSGVLSQAREQARLARVDERVTALVQRTFS
jgi:hypothetical protein